MPRSMPRAFAPSSKPSSRRMMWHAANPPPMASCYALRGPAYRRCHAVGIEDSINGLEACRAAGLDAVLVNNPSLHATVHPAFPSLVEFRLALVRQEEPAHV